MTGVFGIGRGLMAPSAVCVVFNHASPCAMRELPRFNYIFSRHSYNLPLRPYIAAVHGGGPSS